MKVNDLYYMYAINYLLAYAPNEKCCPNVDDGIFNAGV